MFDIAKIRDSFPILSQKVYGRPLIYLDNGATTQKPLCVIEKLNEVFKEYNANIHRGVHYLSDKTSEEYENARKIIQQFIGASSEKEIIFTSGATASSNCVAFSFGERFVGRGDEIIVTQLEHHANIVPWQMLCERKGAKLKVIPIDDHGQLILEEYYNLLSQKTRIVAVTQTSNVCGIIPPLKEIIAAAHSNNIPVLIDGAQGIQHGKVNMTDIDCDFYLFSGHKVYGPTGIGVLYGKEHWLEEMPPYQGGGDMVDRVSFEKTTYNELPFKFEAGTTNYPAAIALATALLYLKEIGLDEISEYEKQLTEYATKKLANIDKLKIFGDSSHKAPIISFLLEGIHQYDTGMILDKLGIAVRTGNHCAQPLMDRFGIEGTVRASACFYNTFEEIDILAEGLQRVKQMF